MLHDDAVRHIDECHPQRSGLGGRHGGLHGIEPGQRDGAAQAAQKGSPREMFASEKHVPSYPIFALQGRALKTAVRGACDATAR
jgi:hypothetical protein